MPGGKTDRTWVEEGLFLKIRLENRWQRPFKRETPVKLAVRFPGKLKERGEGIVRLSFVSRWP